MDNEEIVRAEEGSDSSGNVPLDVGAGPDNTSQKAPNTSRQYYQVGAGSLQRDHSRYFIKYGMALVRNDFGMMPNVRPGDRFILKKGTATIIAVGEAVERHGKCWGNHFEDKKKPGGDPDREWLEDFDGWELPHYCFVDWHQPERPVIVDCKLTRSAFDRVKDPVLQKKAEDILEECPIRSPEPEPGPTRRLSDNEILEFLISEGLKVSSAEDFIENLRRIRLLATYYKDKCDLNKVSETEVRTFLVIPFLIALGWSEQQIKLEYSCKIGSIDIALFDRPYKREINPNSPQPTPGIDGALLDGPYKKENLIDNAQSTSDDHCVLIVEAKTLDTGLNIATEQAMGYGNQFKNCPAILVTNGWCYMMYRREKGQEIFQTTPTAYLNLLTPTERFPLDPSILGAKEGVLKQLLPIVASLSRFQHQLMQQVSSLARD